VVYWLCLWNEKRESCNDDSELLKQKLMFPHVHVSSLLASLFTRPRTEIFPKHVLPLCRTVDVRSSFNFRTATIQQWPRFTLIANLGLRRNPSAYSSHSAVKSDAYWPLCFCLKVYTHLGQGMDHREARHCCRKKIWIIKYLSINKIRSLSVREYLQEGRY
jgi:hypothetical protein